MSRGHLSGDGDDAALARAQILHIPGIGRRRGSSRGDSSPAGNRDDVGQADGLINVGDDHPGGRDMALVAEGQSVCQPVLRLQRGGGRDCLGNGQIGGPHGGGHGTGGATHPLTTDDVRRVGQHRAVRQGTVHGHRDDDGIVV